MAAQTGSETVDMLQPGQEKAVSHGHYFKDVSRLKKLDVYRLIEIYEVSCPVAQHVVKKALAAGKRGAKDPARDMRDIRDSAQRWLDMREEDAAHQAEPVEWPADDTRIDAIGRNGNTGEHYAEVGTRCHECVAEHCACVAR